MTLQNILREAQALSTEERRQLIKILVDTLGSSEISEPSDRKHNLRELRGSGIEIWEEIDVQGYINQQRDDQQP